MAKQKRKKRPQPPVKTPEEQAAANAIMHKCGCMCHEPGVSIMHFMACCEHCYETNTDL